MEHSVDKVKLSVIDPNANDKFTTFKRADLKQLLCELESQALPLRENLGLKKDYGFGMEVEFEHAIKANVQRRAVTIAPDWLWHYEGTVEDDNEFESRGGEIVSPIMQDEPQDWHTLDNLCKMLREEEAICGDKAGGHIHIGSGVVGRDENAILNLLKIWTAFEKEFFRFSYGDKLGPRRSITYGKPIGHDFNLYFQELKERKFPGFKRKLDRAIDGKYHAINFENFVGDNTRAKDTIEFRCPNGTLNAVVWQNNLNCFAKLLQKSKTADFNHDVVDRRLKKYKESDEFYKDTCKVDLNSAVELCDLVFDNNTDKAYFLKQYAKFLREPKMYYEELVKYDI